METGKGLFSTGLQGWRRIWREESLSAIQLQASSDFVQVEGALGRDLEGGGSIEVEQVEGGETVVYQCDRGW